MIGSDLTQDIAELRAEAESLHVDRCDIERPGDPVWDDEAQESVTPFTPVHIAVPCALDTRPVSSRTTVTDETVTAETPRVKVSVALTGIEPDDRVTIAGIGVLWVTHAPVRSNQVQRRLECRWSR